MKTIKNVVQLALVFALLFSVSVSSQDANEEFKPVFLTITTMHTNPDAEGSGDEWLALEKEYHDNVTMKNELILGSGLYFHYFSEDNSEVIAVTVYGSWADIEDSAAKDSELIKAHWPDEDARAAYFKKRNSYYTAMHSDEIMVSTPYQVNLVTESTKPLIYYVKKNLRGNGDGSGFEEYFDNVTSKNKYVKGYFTHTHRYGANSRDAHEVFVFENFSDIEKAFDEDSRLVNEHWPNEDARKEFFKGYSKIFAGHGDAIYQNVPELEK
ncbi:MAG: hypothetical protein COB73_04600 [Flavobacteriaceae bacterium]|nr:MAG: hypothetical protein COB73_04600 [Flavobacteriaceae bacterium]